LISRRLHFRYCFTMIWVNKLARLKSNQLLNNFKTARCSSLPRITGNNQEVYMEQKALSDRLMELCSQHAEDIAQQWLDSLIKNSHTSSFICNPKRKLFASCYSYYKNLRRMYFADNPYKEVQNILDATGYAEEQYSRRVPYPKQFTH